MHLMQFGGSRVGPGTEAVVFADGPLIKHAFACCWCPRCCCLNSFLLVIGFQKVHVQSTCFLKSKGDDFMEAAFDDLESFFLSLFLTHVLCRCGRWRL